MKFAKIKNVKSPTRAHSDDAGIDFYIPDDFSPVEMKVGDSICIESGVKVCVPKGYALIGFNKSGVAVKKGLTLGACVIDESYQGEVIINLNKIIGGPITLKGGDKIAQFVLLPINYEMPEEVNEENLFEKESERGSGAFGSTDRQ